MLAITGKAAKLRTPKRAAKANSTEMSATTNGSKTKATARQKNMLASGRGRWNGKPRIFRVENVVFAHPKPLRDRRRSLAFGPPKFAAPRQGKRIFRFYFAFASLCIPRGLPTGGRFARAPRGRKKWHSTNASVQSRPCNGAWQAL